jgi:hypothetical protein
MINVKENFNILLDMKRFIKSQFLLDLSNLLFRLNSFNLFSLTVIRVFV